MALDFPASPTNGQKYPQPPLAGAPVYTWDGEKWKADGSSGAPTIYVSDTPPTGVPDRALWWESDTGLLYVRFNDGTSTQWVITTPQPDTSVFAFKSEANVTAYSGMQINGGMEVSQELGLDGRNNAGYVVDGWKLASGGTMAIAVYPLGGSVLVKGFPSSLELIIQTAQPSLGAGDYLVLFQPIEGYRTAKLAWGTASAQSITIGFWSSHNRTGVYSVAVFNGLSNRSCVATYTQAAANVAQYNTVTIPGDTAGTWASNNTVGIFISFTFAAGTTYTTAAANTWYAGYYFAAPGQVNGAGSTSDAFRITGVTVLPGIAAPTAAQSPYVMRPYDQELVTCQRYFCLSDPPTGVGTHFGYAIDATNTVILVNFPVEMRATPTMGWNASGSTWTINDNLNTAKTITVGSISSAYRKCAMLLVSVSGGITAGTPCRLQSTGSVTLANAMKFDARL